MRVRLVLIVAVIMAGVRILCLHTILCPFVLVGFRTGRVGDAREMFVRRFHSRF